MEGDTKNPNMLTVYYNTRIATLNTNTVKNTDTAGSLVLNYLFYLSEARSR